MSSLIGSVGSPTIVLDISGQQLDCVSNISFPPLRKSEGSVMLKTELGLPLVCFNDRSCDVYDKTSNTWVDGKYSSRIKTVKTYEHGRFYDYLTFFIDIAKNMDIV